MQSNIQETISEIQKIDQKIANLQKTISELQKSKKTLTSDIYQKFIDESKAKNDLTEGDFVLFEISCDEGCHNNNDKLKIVAKILTTKLFRFTDLQENYQENIGFLYTITVIFPNEITNCFDFGLLEYSYDDDEGYEERKQYKRSELKKISKKEFLQIKKEYLVEKLQEDISNLTSEIETIELCEAQASNDINVGDTVLVKIILYNSITAKADNVVYDKEMKFCYNHILKGKIIKLVPLGQERLKYHQLKTGYLYSIEFMDIPDGLYHMEYLFSRDYISQKIENI